MPFPEDIRWYQAMHSQADVISSAIDSLDVQVPWEGVRVIGIAGADTEKLDPLIESLVEYGDLAGALRSFTKEMFVNGNVAIFVGGGGTKMWRPDWRQHDSHTSVASQGTVLEAKRPPPNASGHGTPVVKQGLAAFKAYWAQQDAHIRELEAYGRNPKGPPPPSRKANDLRAMNAVLGALGFGPWTGDDVPALLHPATLRSEMKGFFEAQILQPYAKLVGIAGTPALDP
jgi:hypothetical protein